MKKLLVILLISILAIFVFVGCEGVSTPPNGSEGEGEGEGETEEISVEIEGFEVINDKPYIAAGNHNLTVTFPLPVKDAYGVITECTGDYNESENDTIVELSPPDGWDPEEGATVWSGTASFSIGQNNCCVSFVIIHSSACLENTCFVMPVIVSTDPELPC
jgi:hypothetical protein